MTQNRTDAPIPARYSTGDPTSFGYTTARNRWPIIITGAIDDIHRAVSDCADKETQEEGKRILEKLAKLKYEVQHDRKLTPIADDGEADVAIYNKELSELGAPTWLSVRWLFCECYLFRRMHTYFSLSTHWKSYDVFARQKTKTFRSSRPAVLELAARNKDLLTKTQMGGEKNAYASAAEQMLVTEMCEISLWGNATDLSLLTSLTYEDLQKLQGSKARKASGKSILVNDLPAVHALLRKAKDAGKANRRVDIVLDNAGFELYADLILAGCLLHVGLATTVVLHPKSMPWFVSDVVPADFLSLLNALADPRPFYETPSEDEALQDKTPAALSGAELQHLDYLFADWSRFHAGGQLVLRPNRVWTHCGSFWRLPAEAPELLEDLRNSELVIFKGDLNYRKLTGDAAWPAHTPFSQALGPLGPKSGLNVLALRTCKADVVVGLKPGEDERLRALEGGGSDSGARKWAWTGKWAVAQFSEGQQGS